jgi:WD40 repeat protein
MTLLSKYGNTKENLCQENFKGQPSRDSSFYSDKGKDISGSLGDNFSRVFDWNTYREAILQRHSFPVKSINLHPDGKTIISRSEDNMIKVWDVYTGECLLTLTEMLGFYLVGSFFKNLHPDSQLSEKAKDFMRQHGAIFDEKDERRSDEAINNYISTQKS